MAANDQHPTNPTTPVVPHCREKLKGMVFNEYTLCSACGFSPEQQSACDYESHVKLVDAPCDRGTWTIGTRFVLKERSKKQPNDEPPILRFVQRHTSIPVPSVVAEWTEPADGAQFQLEERMPGVNLSDVWPHMSADGRKRAAQQTATLLQQLRALQAPRMQNVDGGPLRDSTLFNWYRDSNPRGPLATDAELWEVLDGELGSAPAAERQFLRDNMPPCAPYTFTHDFLDIENITVDGAAGNVTGILNWEHAGYYPVWWQFASATSRGVSQEDFEWRVELSNFMEPQFEEARYWWTLFSKTAYTYYDIERNRNPRANRDNSNDK